jgi:maltose/moltooligosaccharide transporter
MQPFKMMVGDMVNEEQKATAYSIQSFLCNAGSLFGYLFPIFFTWIGISNTAPEGVVPDTVKWSFYCGAALLILCVLFTFAKVKEMNPQEYAEFHGIEKVERSKGQKDKKKEGFVKLLAHAPKTFWTVGLVQFFCWAAFLFMWTYTNGTVAANCWNTTEVASAGYQAAGNWVGVLFAVQAVGSILWATLIPRFKNLKTAYIVSLLFGAGAAVHPADQLAERRAHGRIPGPVQLHHLPASDCGGCPGRRAAEGCRRSAGLDAHRCGRAARARLLCRIINKGKEKVILYC